MKKNHDKNCQYCKHHKGFTIIEMLIAMFVGLVVIGAVYSVFTLQNKELRRQEQIEVMQQNARIGMEMMSKEIMMAGYGPKAPPPTRCTGTTPASEPSSFPYSCLGIVVANAGFISFSSDVSGTTTPSENITYKLDASVLRRNSNDSGAQPVVENISALAFTYLDAAGAVTTDRSAIRTININITAQTAHVDLDSGKHGYFTLEAYVTPRNLGMEGY